jgi:hypothetical protein
MNKIEFGDCREIMSRWKDEGIKVQTCVTSPPYFGLRDYGHNGQIGLEQTVGEYVANMVDVFRHVWHILEDDGTVWLNLGDSYYNYRPGKGQSLNKQTIASNDQDLPSECARRGNKLEGLKENFADGRNPQDKGDSKRHGVPTKASVSTLRKVAKQGGRKGQLAHWMANMKSGRSKKK